MLGEIQDQLLSMMTLFTENVWLQALGLMLGIWFLARVTQVLVAYLFQHYSKILGIETLSSALADSFKVASFWSVLLLGSIVTIGILDMPDKAIQIYQSVIETFLLILWSKVVWYVIKGSMSFLADKPSDALDSQLLPLLQNLLLMSTVVVVILLIFSAWQVDMTAWLASAGILGLAVGFAAKDTLSNVISGVFILADRPYKVGDYVLLDAGIRGQVVDIGLRSTRLMTRDDVEITVPNALIGNGQVTNESGGPDESFRIRLKVSFSYGSDVEQIRELLMSIAQQEHLICQTPEPRVRFRELGDYALKFELLSWVAKPELRGQALDRLNSEVYQRCNALGIEFPYPTSNVHIKSMPNKD